ncbi:hypothetical protein PT274_00705 [Leuconostocaceae bacterium ESL0958]|nr:hypothetical protein [Leuconostocaceae bacterium ESL0958]
MGRIVNQEEHLNNPLKDIIDIPDNRTEEEEAARKRALGQDKN